MEKSVLVTGASGFIGVHLCSALVRAGYRVTALSRQSEPVDFPSRARWVRVRNYEDYRENQPFDFGFHLAAENQPRALLADFVHAKGASLALAEFLLLQPVRHWIYVSSGAVYGDRQAHAVSEAADLDLTSPYAQLKRATEQVFERARHTIVRLSNVIGPHQKAPTVLSDCLKQIRQKKTDPVILRDLAPVRDYLPVEDAVQGLIALMGVQSSGVYNLSTGHGMSVAEICSMMLVLADQGDRQLMASSPHQDPSYLVLDPTRLMTQTGWQAETKVRSSLLAMLNDDMEGRKI